MAEYHAERSPSGADRWMSCPGSIVLSSGIVDTAGAYATEGSAAHDVAAMALSTGADASAYVGRVIDVQGTEVVVTKDMADSVQVYINAVRDRVKAYELSGAAVVLEVEQDVPIGHLTLEEGATGRSDAIIIAELPDNVIIEVWDLKFGRGVEVQAEGNRQGQLYALGAIEKFSVLYEFTQAAIVIHQPRLSSAPSEWVTTPAELAKFAGEVTRASHLVRAAKHCADGGGAEFDDKYLNPSEKACRFCKAKATCPKLREHVATVVVDDFDDLTKDTVEHAITQIDNRSDDSLALAMQAVDLVEDWCKAIRAEVERRLLAGDEVPGYKLVQGRQGPRAWVDADEAETVLKAMRLKQEQMYEFKVISPTTAEKLAKSGDIGPRQWPKVEALITRSAAKPSVAPASDKRPAITVTPVVEEFADLTGEALA